MTKIEWANLVWNPVTGCSKISDGCKNCYAETFAKRLQKIPATAEKYRNGFKPTFHPEELKRNFGKKPKRIFVCSMGDLFHEDVSNNTIYDVYLVIKENPQHQFLLLTKRPDRVLNYYNYYKGIWENLPNLWLGVSISNQKDANKFIPDLLQIPGKHFVSYEPALEGVDLTAVEMPDGDTLGTSLYNDGEGSGIDWVIAGGETGRNARPCKREWIDSIHNQCKLAGIPFFDKKDILGINCRQFPKELK